jgi:hypothetical protein
MILPLVEPTAPLKNATFDDEIGPRLRSIVSGVQHAMPARGSSPAGRAAAATRVGHARSARSVDAHSPQVMLVYNFVCRK